MNTIYKVVKIIDDYTIVINAGTNSGFKKNDKFQIYIVGEEVIDPDTNESLGTLDTVKATVTIIECFPKMSICQHIKPAVNALALIAEDSPQRLNVDSSLISGGLCNDELIIIGDLARPC